ncbi:MAG: alkylation response protein AidB-like acyl-CoA dehydrogenase [Paracoccaceae bacterium]|jgi:alkylation response protein AidB-like acyl-CoA dehydrogenase
MNFDFSEEQTQLDDMLQRFVRNDYGFDARQNILNSEQGFSQKIWQQFAELGLLALTLPEDCDGFGGTAVDTLLVMQSLGRALVLEPYLPTVLSAALIATAGSDEQRRALLPKVASGQCIVTLAHAEAEARYQLNYVTTRAEQNKDGFYITGHKAVVLAGQHAGMLIVSARTAGNVGDSDGISLFLVDPKLDGVSLTAYRNHDGQSAADIHFNAVQLGAEALLGELHQALPLLKAHRDTAIAALCAEAVGIMDALIAETGEYLKTRKQFGVQLGVFQALQHRMADMLLHTEQARSMAYLAAGKHDADEATRARIMAAAKTLVGQSARFVGQQAVQLHGGIGVTEELIIGHYFKRLTLINASLGDADYHLGRFSDMMVAAQLAAG